MQSETARPSWWTAGLTGITLIAFAANALLCRLALGAGQIDPASYTSLRLVSGAAALWAILAWSNRSSDRKPASAGSWASAAMLFLYAVTFSFAYVSLDVGTGALILFGAVQACMILAGLRGGERPHRVEWLGLLVALAGLVYLVSPGISAPAPLGAVLMAIAGVAWGVYSLRGRNDGEPVRATAMNFLRAAPFALLVSLLMQEHLQLSAHGITLALCSGALASGLGYVLWYAALKGLSATRAAIVQLAVPAIAAAGGVLFLSEVITLRLMLASAMILGGVALALRGRSRSVR